MKQHTQAKILRFLSIISISSSYGLLLSACSYQQDIKQLNKDYQHYQPSRYVQDNLKINKTTQSPTTTASSTVKTSQQMQAAQQKLVANKTRANNRLQQTVLNNALFTPPNNLQQTIRTLSNTTEQENWLKNHSSLSAVLTLVLNNNPTIQSDQQATKAALAKYDQVRFLDDNLAQYAGFANKPTTANFPFASLLALKGSIIDQAVETSRLKLLKTTQDVITQTRVAYYELQFAQHQSRLAQKNAALLIMLKTQLADNYATQTTDLKQLVQADIAIEKQRNKRQLAQQAQQVQQAHLNSLLNFSPTFTLGKLDRLTPITLNSDVQSLLAAGQINRVEIAQTKAKLKKMEQIIQLSEQRFYPDLSANYSRFQNRTVKQVGSNATDSTFATRPTSTSMKTKQNNFFGSNDAYVTETKQQYQALQTQLQALQRQTEDIIQQTFAQYQAQQDSYATYQSGIIPKAKTTVDIVMNQYETGESNYAAIIDTQTLLLNARLLALQAVKETNSKVAQLDRFVGKRLE